MLSGWVVDIIIDFLARTVGRWIKSIRSRDWIRVHATLNGAATKPDNLWGCHKVVVSYTYGFRDRLYAGSFKEPFLSRQSCDDYVAIFQGMPQLVVRVNPDNPADSFMGNSDQKFAVGIVSQLRS